MARSCLSRAVFILAAGLAVWPAVPVPTRAASAPARRAIEIRGAWVRWLPAGLPAAGYLKLINPSTVDVFLTAASSPDYQKVELHQSMAAADGGERMIKVDQLRVPAGGEAVLQPGGYHLMLMQPRRAIRPGSIVKVELDFSDGRKVLVRLPVKPADHVR